MTLTAVFEGLEDMMNFAKVMAGNAGSEPAPMQPQTIPVAPVLLQLLKDFGVEALPTLQPEQYGAFATALRGLGAQI